MMHLAPFVILVIVAAVGTVGNLFIIGAVCLYKRLRTLGHVFVVNLAVADLIITAYIMPTGLVTSQSKKNPFSDSMCDFNAFLIMCTLGVSTQSLMLISIERYVHICKTRYYKKLFTPRLAGCYVAAIWIYSAAWTLQGYSGWTRYLFLPKLYVCLVDPGSNLVYNICLVVFGMLVPMAVLAFSYINIFRKVKKSHSSLFKNKSKSISTENLTKSQRRMQGEYRFVVTLFTIVLIFVACWAPTAVVLGLSGRVSLPTALFQTVVWLSFSNSSMNSVVYGIMNKNFRKGYRQLGAQLLCGRGVVCGKQDPSESTCCSTMEDSVSTSYNKHQATEVSSASPRRDSFKKDASHTPRAQPSLPSVPKPSASSGTVTTISTVVSDYLENREGLYRGSPYPMLQDVDDPDTGAHTSSSAYNRAGGNRLGYSAIQHHYLKETIL